MNPKIHLRLKSAWQGFKNPPAQAELSAATPLRALTPLFDESQHGHYLATLQETIDNHPDVSNIALTGPFGSGKSSILQELQRRHSRRIIMISLASLGRANAASQVQPDDSARSTGSARETDSLNDEIQKEIIKQILMRKESAGLPLRHGGRLQPPPRTVRAGNAIFISTIITTILFASGALKRLEEWLSSLHVPRASFYGIAWAAFSFAIYQALNTVRPRLVLEKLSAGPASISIAADSATYIDEYLSEILSYFENVSRDLVVLEDLDRFEGTAPTFEALRSLNTLLNQALETRKAGGKRPTIRFIYAVRDSVFEDLQARSGVVDSATGELARGNRTKFFDQIIPVVPFVSRHNARDLMSKEMAGSGVGSELIRISARHIPDMRLLTSLRNEYDVYLRAYEGHMPPGMSRDNLYALLQYKSVHQSDFEKIPFGVSGLDLVYKQWRQLISENLDEAQAVRRASVAPSKAERAGRARALGKSLEALVAVLMSGIREHYITSSTVSVGGASYQRQEWNDPALWEIISSAGTFDLAAYANQRRYTITTDEFRLLTGRNLDQEFWRQRDEKELARRRAGAESTIAALRQATWASTFARREWRLSDGESSLTFAEICDSILHSQLAKDLIEGGYLDQYFGSYATPYYGLTMPPDGLIFTRQHIEGGAEGAWNVPLDVRSVQAVLDDQGTKFLDDYRLLNFDIVSKLLKERDERIQAVVATIVREGGRDYVTSFISMSSESVALVSQLSSEVPWVLETICSALADSSQDLDPYLDAYFAGVDEGVLDETVVLRESDRDLVSGRLEGLGSFKVATGERSEILAMALYKLQLEAPDLRSFSKGTCMSVAKRGMYSYTESNVLAILDTAMLPLDRMRAEYPQVAAKTLEHLPTYVEILQRKGQPFIEDVAQAPEIICKVAEVDENDYLQALLESVDKAGYLTSAEGFDEETLRTLLSVDAFAPCMEIIDAVYATLGVQPCFFDFVLRHAKELEAEEQGGPEGSPAAMLRHRQDETSAAQRVSAASALARVQLVTDEVPRESGKLLAELVRAGLFEPSVESLRALAPDWKTAEQALLAMEEPCALISPTLLAEEWLRPALEGDLPWACKEKILERWSDYPTRTGDASRRAVELAIEHNFVLSSDALVLMASAGVVPDRLLLALTSLPDLDEAHLSQILDALGGSYAALTCPGTDVPRFPADELHKALLDRLEGGAVVSSVSERQGKLIANKRRR